MEHAFKVPVRRRVHPYAVVFAVLILIWAGIGALLFSWGL